MAKPNYSFEKRQRELAKKKKKEGKLAERAARKIGGPGEEAAADESGGAPVTGEAGEASLPAGVADAAGPTPGGVAPVSVSPPASRPGAA